MVTTNRTDRQNEWNGQAEQSERMGRTIATKQQLDHMVGCSPKTTMNDGEMEQHVTVLQDELQWIMVDCDSKVAMGREMETQLHSTQTQLQATQMELGFVQKQLTTLQKQY